MHFENFVFKFVNYYLFYNVSEPEKKAGLIKQFKDMKIITMEIGDVVLKYIATAGLENEVSLDQIIISRPEHHFRTSR